MTSRRGSSSQEEGEEDMFALLPDTWREAASSIYKLYEEDRSPSSQGKTNDSSQKADFPAENFAVSETWDAEVSHVTSADEASPNLEDACSLCDKAISTNEKFESTGEEEEEERATMPLSTSGDFLQERGASRRLNRERLRWANRVKEIKEEINLLDSTASIGAVETKEGQSPLGCIDTSGTSSSGVDRLEKLDQITSFEFHEKPMESINSSGGQNVSLRPDSPRSERLLHTEKEEEGRILNEVLNKGEAEEDEEKGLNRWDSCFRLMSGSNRRKTKRRTLLAPRCHDAYDQLASAIQRHAAARSARHHLLCGAVEGLLCVRMPCVTRSSSSVDRLSLPRAAFDLGPEDGGCCCCIPTTTTNNNNNNKREGSGLHAHAASAASFWRERMRGSSSSSSRHSSTDLLLLYLLLFKELRWGEAIHARVRRQITQLQGCLLFVQRLEANASIKGNDKDNKGFTMASKDLKELNLLLGGEEKVAASCTAEKQAHHTPEECCNLLHQMKMEEENAENSRVAIEPLVAALRDRRSQAVQELRKAQRIIASAQQRLESCRQRHRQHFVEHASHFSNSKNFLNLRLRFEDLCAISCAQNELFALAFFHCLSQDGQPVTWPVVEAMAEPKVFFLAWEAVRVGLVAFHLFKTKQNQSDPSTHSSANPQLSSFETPKDLSGAACASPRHQPSSWVEGAGPHQSFPGDETLAAQTPTAAAAAADSAAGAEAEAPEAAATGESAATLAAAAGASSTDHPGAGGSAAAAADRIAAATDFAAASEAATAAAASDGAVAQEAATAHFAVGREGAATLLAADAEATATGHPGAAESSSAAHVAAGAAEEASAAAAARGGGNIGEMYFSCALPSPLSSRLLSAVEKAVSLCCAVDAIRRREKVCTKEKEKERIERKERNDLIISTTKTTEEQKDDLFAVVAAAEAARMHHWTIAGCDGMLKLLVATAVNHEKRKKLFSLHAHASFL